MPKQLEAKLECSYCGKSQEEVRKLIAGPTVYICDECVKLCNDILGAEAERTGLALDGTPPPAKKPEGAKESGPKLCCSFCGKNQWEVWKLIAGPSVYVCNECIGLCNDIIAEEIERENVSESVRSRLPEDACAFIAAVLERGSPAAERVSTFAHDGHMQVLDTIHGRGREGFLDEYAKAKPTLEILEGMGTLADKWRKLHQIVGSKTGDSPRSEGQPSEWVRHITENLRFALEVLEALERRLEEPGFEPSRAWLDPANEKLEQARDLLMAGPPGPLVD